MHYHIGSNTPGYMPDETWLKLLAIVEEIKLFIEANRSLLKWKTEETEAA